jgi:hypothetical protein
MSQSQVCDVAGPRQVLLEHVESINNSLSTHTNLTATVTVSVNNFCTAHCAGRMPGARVLSTAPGGPIRHKQSVGVGEGNHAAAATARCYPLGWCEMLSPWGVVCSLVVVVGQTLTRQKQSVGMLALTLSALLTAPDVESTCVNTSATC